MLCLKCYNRRMNYLAKIKEFWFTLSDKIRFLIVGGFNAGVSYALYAILVLFLGESFYQISLALAWMISSVVSFFTQKYCVFNVEGNIFKQYLKCCTTWFFSYLINAVLLELFVKHLFINVYFAQIVATLSCALFTYVLFKQFAFRCKN